MKKRIPAIVLMSVFLSIFIFFITACGNQDTPEQTYMGFQPGTYGSGDLTIHFLELGNKYTGDCVYINYGDLDIIIDAGSKQDSAATIIAYINEHIKDNKLEYVIATHAHEDHIAGFTSWSYGTLYEKTGILDYYDVDLIIDFPKTNSNTATYTNYRSARSRAVAKGTTHYTALQCYRNQDGARRVYNLDLQGNVKLEILYNYYYENNSSNENEYSVCIRITQGDNKYIFTGDLEKAGEDWLVSYYETNHGGLGHSVLYKGGHHGSNTSSNIDLMKAISPEYVCVCTCMANYEYKFNSPTARFPGQGFIDRVAPYTDEIYLTTLIESEDAWNANQFVSFNGNIVFIQKNNIVSINCSNNNIKLKDTAWFEENRKWPDNGK